MNKNLLGLALMVPMIAMADPCGTAITVTGLTTRVVPHTLQARLAGYLTITNNDNVPHSLVSVTSPGWSAVSIVSYYGPDGPKKAQPMTQLQMQPGDSLYFTPGDNHLIFDGFKPDSNDSAVPDKQPKPGATMDVLLNFDTCSVLQQGVPVDTDMQP